jgi:hypothetical protein
VSLLKIKTAFLIRNAALTSPLTSPPRLPPLHRSHPMRHACSAGTPSSGPSASASAASALSAAAAKVTDQRSTVTSSAAASALAVDTTIAAGAITSTADGVTLRTLQHVQALASRLGLTLGEASFLHAGTWAELIGLDVATSSPAATTSLCSFVQHLFRQPELGQAREELSDFVDTVEWDRSLRVCELMCALDVSTASPISTEERFQCLGVPSELLNITLTELSTLLYSPNVELAMHRFVDSAANLARARMRGRAGNASTDAAVTLAKAATLLILRVYLALIPDDVLEPLPPPPDARASRLLLFIDSANMSAVNHQAKTKTNTVKADVHGIGVGAGSSKRPDLVLLPSLERNSDDSTLNRLARLARSFVDSESANAWATKALSLDAKVAANAWTDAESFVEQSGWRWSDLERALDHGHTGCTMADGSVVVELSGLDASQCLALRNDLEQNSALANVATAFFTREALVRNATAPAATAAVFMPSKLSFPTPIPRSSSLSTTTSCAFSGAPRLASVRALSAPSTNDESEGRSLASACAAFADGARYRFIRPQAGHYATIVSAYTCVVSPAGCRRDVVKRLRHILRVDRELTWPNPAKLPPHAIAYAPSDGEPLDVRKALCGKRNYRQPTFADEWARAIASSLVNRLSRLGLPFMWNSITPTLVLPKSASNSGGGSRPTTTFFLFTWRDIRDDHGAAFDTHKCAAATMYDWLRRYCNDTKNALRVSLNAFVIPPMAA